MIFGAGSAAASGYSIATGDINGDGTRDLVVASPGKNGGSGGKGEFEIVWGTLGGQSLIDLENAVTVSRIIGRPTDEPVLARVACVDLNSDGLDDIIICEPRWNSFRGRCYVVFGSESFPNFVDLATPSPLVLTVSGPAPFSAFGISACGGDVDGDGYADAVLSAYGVDEVIVIRGGTSFPSSLDSAVPSEHLIHIRDDLHPGQGLGQALACKDVDLDGYDDILFGCNGNAVGTENGMAILLHGGPDLPPLLLLGSTTLQKVVINNTSAVDYLGSDVEIADFDGDGETDVVITADGVDGDSGQNCGAVYVFYSANQLPSNFRVDDSNISRTVILGSGAYTWWGTGLCGADFDKDGHDDLAMRCASVDNNSATRDSVSVIYGRAARLDTIWVVDDLASSKFASEYFDEHLGRGIAASDLTGDGVSDMIMSAYGYDIHRGRILVVFGTAPTGIDRTPRAQVALRTMPNPFSENTTLAFSLESTGSVRVTIYDVLGRQVRVLSNSILAAGSHSLSWDGRDGHGRLVAQGLYFARIETSLGTDVKKLLLVR